MIIEYTTTIVADFTEDIINELVERAKENKWDIDRIKTAVDAEIFGFDDEVFYTWGTVQTDKVVEEICHRLKER